MTKFANAMFTRMSSVNPSVKVRYLRAGFDIMGDHPQAHEARKVFVGQLAGTLWTLAKDVKIQVAFNPRKVGAAHLGQAVRGHWSIENNLHWCLDVSFSDDAARVRKDHGPVNLAAIKRHVLGLVKRSLPKASTPLKAKLTSLKTRRFLCSLDDDYLIRTLAGGNSE